MLSVFICEDDARMQKFLFKCVKRHIHDSELDMDMPLCVSDPAEIIRHIKKQKTNGLYFLDIELEGGYNGVKVAQNIRQYDPRGYIAFVTAHPKYLSLTFEYKVEPLAYIPKENEDMIRQNVIDCIENAYKKHVSRSNDGCFIFQTKSNRLSSCSYDDILFFETTAERGAKRIIIHTRKRCYIFYNSIDKILGDLPAGQFYKCHKSYIVNIGNITEIGRKALSQGDCRITMPDGAECLVSRRKRKGLVELLNAL